MLYIINISDMQLITKTFITFCLCETNSCLGHKPCQKVIALAHMQRRGQLYFPHCACLFLCVALSRFTITVQGYIIGMTLRRWRNPEQYGKLVTNPVRTPILAKTKQTQVKPVCFVLWYKL